MKKRNLFLIAATAIMLIIAACSGEFVDPSIQEDSSGGGGGTCSPDDGGSGGKSSSSNGKSSSSKKDCSAYQQEYDSAKSSVEFWKGQLASSERMYDNLLSIGVSASTLTSARNLIENDRSNLQSAESNVSSVRSAAASAGCSVY